MNQPYGTVDIIASFYDGVPKTTAWAILASFAERDELSQKTYGAYAFCLSLYNPAYACMSKTALFAPNQDKTAALALAPDEVVNSERECAELEETDQIPMEELKAA
jgi:hypothetical protein